MVLESFTHSFHHYFCSTKNVTTIDKIAVECIPENAQVTQVVSELIITKMLENLYHKLPQMNKLFPMCNRIKVTIVTFCATVFFHVVAAQQAQLEKSIRENIVSRSAGFANSLRFEDGELKATVVATVIPDSAKINVSYTQLTSTYQDKWVPVNFKKAVEPIYFNSFHKGKTEAARAEQSITISTKKKDVIVATDKQGKMICEDCTTEELPLVEQEFKKKINDSSAPGMFPKKKKYKYTLWTQTFNGDAKIYVNYMGETK